MNKRAALGFGTGVLALGAFFALRRTESSIRAEVVKNALGEVGKGDATRYWRFVMPGESLFPKEWCGAFALWTIRQAGIGQSLRWEVGKGFLYKLPLTKNPQPGDIAYFTNNQHQAVIQSVTGNTLNLINGNGMMGKVTVSSTPIGNAAGFYSIKPLIDEVL